MSNEPVGSGRDSASDFAVTMHGVTLDVPNHHAPNGNPQRILSDINLTVQRGGLLHVVGPSGTGKSSLIRLINRLDEPTEGSVTILGRPIHQWPPRQLRQRVAMVFQEPTLLNLPVRDNLVLPFRLSGSMPRDLDERIEQAMRLAEISPDILQRESSQLSVGQKQRVTLARALISEPQVLLLDEPTAGLDPQTAGQLLASLVGLRQRWSLTIVMATHRLGEARRLGGQMLVLIDGRVTALDDVQSLLENPPPGPGRDFLRAADRD